MDLPKAESRALDITSSLGSQQSKGYACELEASKKWQAWLTGASHLLAYDSKSAGGRGGVADFMKLSSWYGGAGDDPDLRSWGSKLVSGLQS